MFVDYSELISLFTVGLLYMATIWGNHLFQLREDPLTFRLRSSAPNLGSLYQCCCAERWSNFECLEVRPENVEEKWGLPKSWVIPKSLTGFQY